MSNESKRSGRESAETPAAASDETSLNEGLATANTSGESSELAVPAALRGPGRLRDPERLVGAIDTETPRRRFVPGGVPISDGSVPDFTLSLTHLFTADNGVLNRKRNASAQPITLSIQAGPRPVTPLLERVVEALTNIGLEPTQTRPLVHSFSDAAGRSARVRLAHSPAHGDLIEIEIEPSISPSAMASVMALLSDLEFDPADTMSSAPSRQY